MIARQRRLVVGIALLLGALAGCASGQVTQTANQDSAVNGANGQAGPIAVRDAMFVYPPEGEHSYPAGSAVSLTLTIANAGGTEDRLVMVETPAATSVRLDGATTIPGRGVVHAVPADLTNVTETTSTGPAPIGGPSATSAPTSVATSAPTSAATSAATPPAATSSATVTTSGPATSGPATTSETKLPPGELTIVLENLTTDIRPGRTVLVVLLFERAGQIELLVPIAGPDEGRGESRP